MAKDYSGLKATAERLIAKFGKDATLRKASPPPQAWPRKRATGSR